MKITLIGTGNVAFHLGKRLRAQGVEIAQVVGRNAERAEWLAAVLATNFTTDFEKIRPSSDLFIIAVADDGIEEVAARLSPILRNNFVVHTSGSVASAVLQPFFKQFGTLYPLQTFSIGSQPDFQRIPIFINANSPNQADFLKKIAEKISPQVCEISVADRLTLHVAAVFVNNFTNHLFKIGAEILEKQRLPFDILLPLIDETVNKIRQQKPAAAQTGPARRGDDATIEKHLNFLEKTTPQYDLLYTLLSISINENLHLNHP